MTLKILGRTVGPLVLVAAALTAVQLALRAWIGYRGYFSLDDYVFYTRAAQPLFSNDLPRSRPNVPPDPAGWSGPGWSPARPHWTSGR